MQTGSNKLHDADWQQINYMMKTGGTKFYDDATVSSKLHDNADSQF